MATEFGPSCKLGPICCFTSLRRSRHCVYSGAPAAAARQRALLSLLPSPSQQPAANFKPIVVSSLPATLSGRVPLAPRYLFETLIPPSPPDVTCGPSESSCKDGSCVAASAWCNQVIECADASDEKGCSKSSPSGDFAFRLPWREKYKMKM